MSLDVKSRYDAPPPCDIHRYPIDPDDSGFHDEASETFVEIEAEYYPAPLAKYLGHYVRNGDVLIDTGCGEHPVYAMTLMQGGAEIGNELYDKSRKRVRVVALNGGHVETVRRNIREMTGAMANQFLVVACDLDSLNSSTLSRNVKRRPECAKRLDSLQEFLAEAGGVDSAQADVLFCGNILHSIDLGEPFDFLLDRVKPGGKIIISGTPDIRWPKHQCPPPGRRMADFRRYLEAEGCKILSHEYCGYVLTEARLKRIGSDVVEPVCRRTDFAAKGEIDNGNLVKSVTDAIIGSANSSNRNVNFGAFGIGGDFRLFSTGYTKSGAYNKEPEGYYVTIPGILAPPEDNTDKSPIKLMFAPQEIIVAKKAESNGRDAKLRKKPPLAVTLSGMRARFEDFLSVIKR